MRNFVFNMKQLSEEIGDRSIIIIPTNHVSPVSFDLVERTIRNSNPDSVCVELCDTRYQKAIGETDWDIEDITNNELLADTIKQYKSITDTARSSIGLDAEDLWNTDMGRGIEVAQEMGIDWHLVDKDFKNTLSDIENELSNTELTLFNIFIRSWASFARFVFNISPSDTLEEALNDVGKMRVDDINDSFISRLSSDSGIGKVLVKDRDRIISENTLKVAESSDRVVLVIGAGHYPGVSEQIIKSYDGKVLTVVADD